MYRILILLLFLLSACGAPDMALRATTQPYPTNVPATPAPGPTAPALAYPPPAYPAPAGQNIVLASVPLSATFTSSTTAVISWQQPPGVRGTCLLRQYGAEWPAGWCWQNLAAGPMWVDVPGTLTDPRFRPAEGDVYQLWMDGEIVGSAVLGQTIWHTVYLPLAIHSAPSAQRAVYLPIVRA